MSRVKWVVVALVVFVASVAYPLAAREAGAAVVNAPPVWPIPAGAPAGPPPIPTMPAAGEATPPADAIADPITAGASCGGWQLQSNYGDRWPAASSWWEYRCSDQDAQYHNTCAGPACDAFCPTCFWETQDRIDNFVWDGSNAVFYGEAYSDSVAYDSGDSYSSADWWDAPTAQWYLLSAFPLSISKDGTGSGVVSSSPAGISCGDTCFEIADAGSSGTLTATPDASSVFAGWSGDCSGTDVCQVTMDQAHSVTATFEPKRFTLTVSTAGTGSGLVYMSPGGTGCRSCTESFDVGTAVGLTPSADASSTFTGWSGDCSGTGICQVTMDQARSVTATFALKGFTLRVAKGGTGSGQVNSSPAGIGCGSVCEAGFDAGTAITLTATADASSIFTGWSGDCSGTGVCQLTMDQSHSVIANFALNMPPKASFSATCTGLTCTFDASGSADPDGTIANDAWDFGDGANGSGKIESHTYGRAESYTVTLTVTDNAGATARTSKAVNPISLSARGYKQNGLQKVSLSWNGPSGTSFDVYRNGAKIATVQATSYTDNIDQRGSGTYTYRVCAPASSTCSYDVRVGF